MRRKRRLGGKRLRTTVFLNPKKGGRGKGELNELKKSLAFDIL